MQCKMSRNDHCQIIAEMLRVVECAGLPEDIAQCPFWCARTRNEGNHIKEIK